MRKGTFSMRETRKEQQDGGLKRSKNKRSSKMKEHIKKHDLTNLPKAMAAVLAHGRSLVPPFFFTDGMSCLIVACFLTAASPP